MRGGGGWQHGLAGLALGAVLAAFAPAGAGAQDFGKVVSPILIVDRERLFRESAYGKRIAALLDQERSRLEAETRAIEAELEAEELALTEARPGLSPQEFRARADAFDDKVQALRRDRDAAQNRLVDQIEKAQLEFLEQVNPILAALMSEANAVILMDRRVVLLSMTRADITSEAILRIDAALGDGSDAGGETGDETGSDTGGETGPDATDAAGADNGGAGGE